MSKEKCCCNCLHCARWRTSKGIECHCDLTDRYLGYLEVMDTDITCCRWEKENKWDIEKEHYSEVYEKGREDALDIDMEKPMHFTDEQKAWVKNYIMINAKRQRADAIDECINILKDSIPLVDNMDIIFGFKCAIERLEQLKEGGKNVRFKNL